MEFYVFLAWRLCSPDVFDTVHLQQLKVLIPGHSFHGLITKEMVMPRVSLVLTLGNLDAATIAA